MSNEPVAWMVYTQGGQSCYVTDNPADISPNQRALPLYTEPVPTDEDLLRQALEALEVSTRFVYADLRPQCEDAIAALRERLAETADDLARCPNCGGPADNGHDREVPPSPYWCSKCTES